MISQTLNIDCNKFLNLKQFKKGFFDLIIADPPYFSGPEKRMYYGQKVSSRKVKRIDYDVIDSWELPDLKWFNKVKQACDFLIIWGGNYFDFIGPVHATPRGKELDQWLIDHPVGWIVWDKCNGKSSFNDYELAWTNIDMPTVIYKFMWNGMNQGKNIFEGHVMQGNKKLNHRKIHPTEKPIFLYKWLLYKFAKPGFKILDTHLGSGSHRIAAYEMGFYFWGLEVNKTYFDKEELRFQRYLNKNISQLKIFA